MKKLAYIILIGIAFSCDSIVGDINENPNSPTTAPFQNVLTGAQVGNIIFQTGETARRAGIFCGYYNGIQRQHQGFNNYTVTTGDFSDLWEDSYEKTWRNVKVASDILEEEGSAGISLGILQVMEALTAGTTAALWGDIPFNEAADLEFENPEFEGQQLVYDQIQLLLDDAITNLQTNTNPPPGGSDIYFDGNAQSWIELAYTLKARYYLHTGNYPDAITAAENGISSGDRSMMAPHTTADDGSNLNFQFFAIQVRGADVIVSDLMVSLMNPNASTSPDAAAYRGNAKTDETARYNYYFVINDIGHQPNTENGMATRSSEAPIVTYSENLLILAEAHSRNNDFDAALAALNDFRAYMDGGGYLEGANLNDLSYDAYVEADFQNGGIENADGIPQNDALLREIVEERYVTLFSQIEGFNDVRRMIGESTRVPVEANVGDDLPQRFLYPQTELDRNTNTPNPIPGFFAPTPINAQ